MKKKIILSSLMTLIILSASFYMLIPDKAKIVFESTRTKFYVFEEGKFELGATEYFYLFDGTAKMRAKNRSINYSINRDYVTWTRIANYKDNITTIQTVLFNSLESDIKNIPVESKAICYNCEGKIVHFEYRDLIYDGMTRAATSPESFGRSMSVEWQDGYDWAKVYQQKIASDKLIIRYRPKLNVETYLVRMFDPPSTPGIYVNESTSNLDIEQGSEVNITAIANNSASTVCISADHGEIGENYSCGTNTTSFLWNASSNIRKFNDSNLDKLVNFSGSETINLTMYQIKNDSYVESFYLDLVGIPNGTLFNLWEYQNESDVSSTGSFEVALPVTNSWDEDFSTRAYPLDGGGNTFIYQNFTCDNCTNSIDENQSFIKVKGPSTCTGSSGPVNYTLGTYNCENNPVQLRVFMVYGGMFGSINISCWDGSAWANFCTDTMNTGFYEATTYFYEEGNATYTKDVKIDFQDDEDYDWVSWGDIEETQTRAKLFNDSTSSMTADFTGRGSSSVYLKLPKNMNVSSATIDITGSVNNYGQRNRFELIQGDPDADPQEFIAGVAPVCDQKDGTDDIYCFGGQMSDGICTDKEYNCSYDFDVDLGANALNSNTDLPWDMYFGHVIYSPTDSVFYVFGGWDGSVVASTQDGMYEYNPSTDAYTAQTATPDGRVAAQYAFLSGTDNIFVCGGYTDQGGSLVYNKSCFSYDVSANTYNVSHPDMPDGMERGWMEQLNDNEMIVWGGTRRGSGASGGRTYIYNISDDSWRTSGTLPDNPYAVSGVSFGENIFSFGGYYTPPEYNYNIYWYNDSANDWETIEYYDFTYNGVKSNWSQFGTSCVEVERSTGSDGYFCVLNGAGYDTQNQRGWYYPNTISMIVEDHINTSYVGSVDLTSTVSITDFSSEINNQLIRCTEDSEGYCNMRLVFSNFGSGKIIADNLEILTPLERINLGVFNVSCINSWCNETLSVSAGSTGLINISNISVDYLGTSNILFWRNDSDGNSSSLTATIYYSDYSYALPQNYDYIEFIPTTPTSKNITPYGQTPTKPMINITTLNTGGKNMSWYFLLDDTVNLSCVNITVSNVANNKSAGNLLVNSTWYEYADNVGPNYDFGLWMWADYNCNFTSWKMWMPSFYFRGCAEGSVCSEEYGT